MFDERHYSPMAGDSEDAENRMNMANELAAASSEEAEQFVDDYIEQVTGKFNEGELSKEDLRLLQERITAFLESKGY